MNLREKLNFFNLDEQYNEESLNAAYQKKLKELNLIYESLKLNLKKNQTIKGQEQITELCDAPIMKIILSEKITKSETDLMLTTLQEIKENALNGLIDMDILQNLSHLKFDGSDSDFILLFLISKGIDPNNKQEIIKAKNSYEFQFFKEPPTTRK